MNNVVVIGSGRVAEALCGVFTENVSVNMVQIVGRNIERCRALAAEYKIEYTTDFSCPAKADYYIIAVSDNAIGGVSEAIAPYIASGIVCHTSGATPIERLSGKITRRGVFYPLQSFSGGKIDWKDVPFFIEAVDKKDAQILMTFAKQFSSEVYEVDSVRREKVHLAAVFVNNFVNHIFTLSDKIIEEQNLPKNLLRRLIYSTFENIIRGEDSYSLQTGPARRGDMVTLNRHLALLNNDIFSAEVYKVISNSILNMYKNEKF